MWEVVKAHSGVVISRHRRYDTAVKSAEKERRQATELNRRMGWNIPTATTVRHR